MGQEVGWGGYVGERLEGSGTRGGVGRVCGERLEGSGT